MRCEINHFKNSSSLNLKRGMCNLRFFEFKLFAIYEYNNIMSYKLNIKQIGPVTIYYTTYRSIFYYKS